MLPSRRATGTMPIVAGAPRSASPSSAIDGAELGPVDRAWFAEDLRDLLVEAVMPGVEPSR